jgi:hypothetical protein
MRLTIPEVEIICSKGYLEDKIIFGKNELVYALLKNVNSDRLSAELSGNRITVNIPAGFLKDWYANDIVGFSNDLDDTAGNSDELLITIEKDFKCIERTTEDQSDNYENPNKTC